MKKHRMYLFFSFAFIAIHPVNIKAQVNVNDSLALVDLYNNTDGAYWKNNNNWLTAKPVSKWYGITVVNNRVNSIALGVNRLKGIIPSSIGNLDSLSILSLYRNKLSDTIPAAISKLIMLTNLDVGGNKLTGKIPVNIGKLVNLVTLDMQFNQLSGSIPTSIGKLLKLQSIYLNYNLLTGSIPATIENLVQLQYVYLNNNQLSGTLPTQLGNLTQITELSISNNIITGSIPASIINLENIRMLDLSFNKLSDTIPELPASFGKKKNDARYNHLRLNNNQLTGKIPAFGSDTSTRTFVEFNMSNNKLSGSIPAYIGFLNIAGVFNLSYNNLTGSIPANFKNLVTVEVVLDHNNLSGEIPDSFGYMHIQHGYSTFDVNLSYNALSGSIPASLNKLPGSKLYLDLSNNNFSGILPASLFKNSLKLYSLNLSHNKLSGNIPSSLQNASYIEFIDISHNNFGTSVPLLFSKFLGYLNYLNISSNKYNFNGLEELVMQQYDSLLYSHQANIALKKSNSILSVNAGGTLSNNTYRWYQGSKLIATIQGDSTFTPMQTGNYSVKVSNAIATKLTLYSDTVHINLAQVSNAIASSTIENIFSVYPNPAKTYTTVSFNANSKISESSELYKTYACNNFVLRLIDANGNLLQTKNITTTIGLNTVTIDMRSYAAGSYFITLTADKLLLQTLPVNKQ